MGFLGGLFGGGKKHKAKTTQLPLLSGEQDDMLKQLLAMIQGPMKEGMHGLSNILSDREGAFDQWEAPMKRQFEEETVPGLGERFSGLGAGSQQSSAFGQQLGKAGESLTEQLSAQRAGLKNDAMSQIMSMLGIGMGTKTHENVYQPGHQSGGFLGSLMGGAAGGIGGLPTMYMQRKMLGL